MATANGPAGDVPPRHPAGAADSGASGDGPRLFKELDRKGKVLRIVTIAFLVLHLTALLVGGAIPKIRNFFTPAIGFYADAIKMTNSWGMFGKPPNSTNVQIEGVRTNGAIVVLSTTDGHKRSWWERIVDSRMRKFEGRLTEPGDLKRLGDAFFDYYCREGKKKFDDLRDVRIRNIVHETKNDDDAVTREATTTILTSRACDRPQVTRIPLPDIKAPPPPPPVEGGEP